MSTSAALAESPVLVTGATGFIGSHVVRRLVTDRVDVQAIARPGADRSRLRDVDERVRWCEADLTDEPRVREVLARASPRTIVHLASHTDVRRSTSTVDGSIADLRMTLNLLRWVADERDACRRFVHTGSCEEYGDNPVPFREDQPPNPVSPYSAAKTAATLFCRMFHKTLGLPVVVVRPFLTYGPGQSPHRFLSQAIESAMTGRELPMTDGLQTREFNFVTDIADGLVRAAASPGVEGEIINLGNGTQYSLREVIDHVSAAVGTPVKAAIGALPRRPGEAEQFYCDNGKARRMLGWAPSVDLDDGLRATVDWLRRGVPLAEPGR